MLTIEKILWVVIFCTGVQIIRLHPSQECEEEGDTLVIAQVVCAFQ